MLHLYLQMLLVLATSYKTLNDESTYIPVRKVIQVDVSQPRLPAVKRLVTVLALQVQGLSLVNHLDVLPEIQGLAETLGAVIAHEAALMSRLFVPDRKENIAVIALRTSPGSRCLALTFSVPSSPQIPGHIRDGHT